jgi:hypothetical protein
LRALATGAALLILFAGGLLLASDTPHLLRVDGLYRSYRVRSSDAEYAQYFRFYSDGVVVVVSSTARTAEVSTWLTRANKKLPQGRYVLSGQQLKIETRTPDMEAVPGVEDTSLKGGSVWYDGTVQGDRIRLKWRSGINGQRGQLTLTFQKSELAE